MMTDAPQPADRMDGRTSTPLHRGRAVGRRCGVSHRHGAHNRGDPSATLRRSNPPSRPTGDLTAKVARRRCGCRRGLRRPRSQRTYCATAGRMSSSTTGSGRRQISSASCAGTP